EIWNVEKSIDDCIECPVLPYCLGMCPNERYISSIKCKKEIIINNIKRQMQQKIVALYNEKKTS
ncbi:MAG: hypothetical protein J6M66_07440, partial [Lachnospiraceae bacterium]|nr:hypothetical protein [Lachnospiraceae bacterium]